MSSFYLPKLPKCVQLSTLPIAVQSATTSNLPSGFIRKGENTEGRACSHSSTLRPNCSCSEHSIRLINWGRRAMVLPFKSVTVGTHHCPEHASPAQHQCWFWFTSASFLSNVRKQSLGCRYHIWSDRTANSRGQITSPLLIVLTPVKLCWFTWANHLGPQLQDDSCSYGL